jgi:hypothetical protein
MVCTHLSELYQLCEKHQLRLGGSDLIRLVCRQCDQEETCPSVLMEEYDAVHGERSEPRDRDAKGPEARPS